MSKGKLRVALLSGGRSGEREVSLKSGAGVADALDKGKYEVFHYDPATDLTQLAADSANLDVAVIILHGKWGEDGTVQGFLDLIGLPYQGSGVLSSALCMDKRAAKNMYRYHGLPVAKDMVIDREKPFHISDIVENVGLPVVVKPSCEGSSLGLSICRTAEELETGLTEALACGRWVIVEEFVTGQEYTSSILGNDELEALPLIQISPGEGYDFFSYDAKYLPGATEEICPAPLPEDLTQKAKELGIAAHKALFCRGYSRTDMILKDGQFRLLETNTIPGMTETSLFPRAARVGGYPFDKLMDRLIELALEDHR